MNKSKFCIAISIACLFVSSALAASYIKIGGIDDESKDKNHTGWINVVSVSPIQIPKDAATGLPTGKRQHKPITITKRVDKTSPLFVENGTNGQMPHHQSSMTIEQDGTTHILSGVKVLTSKKNGNTETLALSYASVSVSPKTVTAKKSIAVQAKTSHHNASRSNN